MKLLPENKKKTIILLSVIGVCVIASVYFIFFFGKSDVPEVAPQSSTNATPPASGTPGGSTAPAGDSTATAGDAGPVVGKSQVLPYGSTLNTKILEQDSFKILKYFRPVEVLPEELGKPNPFE